VKARDRASLLYFAQYKKWRSVNAAVREWVMNKEKDYEGDPDRCDEQLKGYKPISFEDALPDIALRERVRELCETIPKFGVIYV